MVKATVIAAGAAIVFAGVVAPVASVSAQSNASATSSQQQSQPIVISVPHGTVKHGDKDSIHELASKNVVNGEYKVTVKSTNQSSVHPNSDIFVKSNGRTISVADVESKEFVEKTAEGTLYVTDGKVTVSVKLGQDKVFSGGVDIVLTKVVTPKPEEPKKEEPKAVAPAELPKTGTGAMLSAVAGVSALGYSVHAYASSRRALRK